MKKILYLSIALFFISSAYGQKKGVITGTVKDKNLQDILIGVLITLQNDTDTLKTRTDLDGKFKFEAPVGKYNLETKYVGYEPFTAFNINISSGNAEVLEIELEDQSEEFGEVTINASKMVKATDMTTPLSTQKLTAEEIKVNPGGNFDVSKVIQVLPGVAGGTSPNRNDIIVRGGGPSENVYYLDGIEIPVLNHFQTQGASGGATGILNVSFIRDVQLTSSAFDSRYDNALASTIVIKQRNGNPDKLSGNFRLSGSEAAATLEGPLGKKTTFMASARRSYLQFLFKLIDLPIRPDYWDFQYKINHKINKKTELNFIGIGAIDNFRLAVPEDADANTEYINRSNPLIKQWNYTVGASLKRLIKNGYFTVALSRNMFFNGADRYANNAIKEGPKLLSLKSHEIENKLRFNVNKFIDGWKISYGLSAQYVKYDLDLFNTIQDELTDSTGTVISPSISFNTASNIDFYKFGAYGHVSKYFLKDKLLLSGGVRSDMNTYTDNGLNPLETISPRLSTAYSFNDKWNISASVGSYFKLPVYTVLGYRDMSGELANKNLDYINSIHYTVGGQYIPKKDLRFTLEAFYKDYRDYPVSLTDSISLANIGTDFSTVGNDTYASTGRGRVYGVEAYVQQKLINRLFYIVSATVYKSEFSGYDGVFRPSTWDYGFVFSTTMGYKFKKNWDLGVKYRVSGGQPYTPFDLSASRQNYLTTGVGVLDYAQLNSERLPIYQQFDIRVDKKINFDNVSLTLFVDIQNLFMFETPRTPNYTFQRNEDNTGFETTDGNPIKSDGSNGIPVILTDPSSTVVPSIGFIFEF
ncbi:TonB-dependent receptor [Brumimicrobium salinarum]|uniref:TonB-dependent receptor n=1 Tax=Brumimicrobium salinarum TaxID=2058658 RepID=A0A2I0QZI1_9FLAO|nr:TonB-dependent receptor [Brumimicrobium salinarum]PKR79729.1 TonB-dependent receptor [Brumimicrobium salinarum]